MRGRWSPRPQFSHIFCCKGLIYNLSVAVFFLLSLLSLRIPNVVFAFPRVWRINFMDDCRVLDFPGLLR